MWKPLYFCEKAVSVLNESSFMKPDSFTYFTLKEMFYQDKMQYLNECIFTFLTKTSGNVVGAIAIITIDFIVANKETAKLLTLSVINSFKFFGKALFQAKNRSHGLQHNYSLNVPVNAFIAVVDGNMVISRATISVV